MGLVLVFKTSKMLAFSAAPVGPELALPPQPETNETNETIKNAGAIAFKITVAILGKSIMISSD